MTTLLQSCLFLLVLSNFLLLGTRRVAGMTRLTAFQGVLLAALLLSLDHALLAGAVLLIKGALLPGLLWRTQKRLPADALICPARRVGFGVLAGMAGLVFSIWLDGKLVMPLGLYPPLLLPTKGRHGLRDYEKVFCASHPGGVSVFDLRGVDRARGALVVVRPDQYIAHVLPLGDHAALAAFFTPFMQG